MTLKDVKTFLPRVNCKVVTNRLREVFEEVDTRNRGELGFDDFVTLYQKLMFDNVVSRMPDEFNISRRRVDRSINHCSLLRKNFPDRDRLMSYSENKKIVSLQEFHRFLVTEQHTSTGNDYQEVSKFVRDYLQDPQRDVQEPYFTVSEFMDYLYSKSNEIWDSRNDEVTQDMTRPLCDYWIASSHNT